MSLTLKIQGNPNSFRIRPKLSRKCELILNFVQKFRIIVNPDFVESLDNSDGAVEFDPDDQKKYDEAMEDNEIGY